MKRKICVVTGSRADYGLLRSVMQEIKEDGDLDLRVIVTGMHLSSKFGNTYKEIEGDGFEIDYRIECLNSTDSAISLADSMGKVLEGCVEIFDALKPDIVLVLGDRFEIFAAAAATLISRIPLAHIHGGEKTLGSYDEAFRHSITKMAQIHFVATKEYRNRVIQLGEHPSYVYQVGSVGIDDIKGFNLLSREELENKLNIKINEKSLLVTFHPETLSNESPLIQMTELLSALSECKNTTLIFTLPNADTGGLHLIDLIERFVRENRNAYVFKNLGRFTYLSCLATVDGVVGNSSSGFLEAPSFKIGTINIGSRQTGRIKAPSIINVNANKQEVLNAIRNLYSEEFMSLLETVKNPYGDGGASSRIKQVLKQVSLDGIIRKDFFDLEYAPESHNRSE
jgi:GDP/UDP-N,N'-diacetylbacillosamine 2-epimerase (hydrolysing)